MSNFIAVKNSEGEWQHHAITPEVALYIRQLETYVKHPNQSNLKEFYPRRFGD